MFICLETIASVAAAVAVIIEILMLKSYLKSLCKKKIESYLNFWL